MRIKQIGRALTKRGLNAFAKTFDSCQPAQSAQADMDCNFFVCCQFLYKSTDQFQSGTKLDNLNLLSRDLLRIMHQREMLFSQRSALITK